MSVKVQITQPSSVNLNLTTGNSITIGSDGDSHNDLKGIQGGTVGQRYHLTQDEVALIHQNDLDIDTVSGLLTTDLVIATGELNDRLTTAESDISTLENATGQLLEQIVSNDNDISTISGLLSNDALTDIVFQTGNQIISGLKVFEDDLGVNANINLTGDLSIDGAVSTVDSIQLDTSAGITVGQGQFAWNSEDLTVDLGLDTNVTLQVGQEQVVRVKCTDPLGVYDGMPVYAYGTIGGSDNIEVRRFSAAAEGVDELYFIGVATETIAQNNVGFVTTFGRVRNVDGRAYGTNQGVKDPADTGNWQFGDVLYVSPNVSGTLTTIVPTSPDKRMAIAMVLKAPNQSNITLMVRAEHGYHLNELHDVYAGTPSDGQALIYNAANERWENTTLNLAYLPLSGGTLTGSLDITGDLTVDTDTLYVDSADSRVGIGTDSPNAKLEVNGTVIVQDDADFNGEENTMPNQTLGGGNSSVITLETLLRSEANYGWSAACFNNINEQPSTSLLTPSEDVMSALMSTSAGALLGYSQAVILSETMLNYPNGSGTSNRFADNFSLIFDWDHNDSSENIERWFFWGRNLLDDPTIAQYPDPTDPNEKWLGVRRYNSGGTEYIQVIIADGSGSGTFTQSSPEVLGTYNLHNKTKCCIVWDGATLSFYGRMRLGYDYSDDSWNLNLIAQTTYVGTLPVSTYSYRNGWMDYLVADNPTGTRNTFIYNTKFIRRAVHPI